MRIEVYRRLPDGSTRIVMPFHICQKGIENIVLCRDEEDYDVFVKIIFLSARAKNVIVIIYTVLSNHFHASVLASSQEDADACGEEIKRRFSMWMNKKYGESGVLRGVKVSAIIMTDRRHIRNALAYIPRNALDNGQNVNTYKWSGYRGMFCRQKPDGLRPVASLTRREAKAIFHTADLLDNVQWQLNENNELEPFSVCDHEYLEQAFENDQAFFLKTIGLLNPAEMRHSLEGKTFSMMPDSELFNTVNELSERWYGKGVKDITMEKTIRLLSYVSKTNRTSEAQLARVFGLKKEVVGNILRH